MSKKILIIEEENSLRGILRGVLKEKGFSILEALDGEAGLETAIREHPDLILLDIMLPKMDGMTMVKKLREDSWGKNAQIFVLTNSSDPEKIEQAMESKVFTYLIKNDINVELLVGKVIEVIGKP